MAPLFSGNGSVLFRSATCKCNEKRQGNDFDDFSCHKIGPRISMEEPPKIQNNLFEFTTLLVLGVNFEAEWQAGCKTSFNLCRRNDAWTKPDK
jgi:hypothetical protein